MSWVAVAIITATATTGAAVYQTEEQKKQVRHQEHLNRVAASKQEAKLKEKKADEEKTAIRNRQLADIRRRAGMRGFGGDTVKTGQTLLGAGQGTTLLGG